MDTEAGSAAAKLRKDLDRYRANWDTNAKLDALWAVLSLRGKLGNGWNERAFFATGEQEIDEVFRFAERAGVALPSSLDNVLDFGCGVGRLTEPLARRAAKVVGVDISREMIHRARIYFPALTFHLTEKNDLTDFEASTFDLIYTNIVLQHLNANVQQHYIREFSRLLRPNGLAILQIPSRGPAVSRSVSLLRMVASLRPRNAVVLLKKALAEKLLPWQASMELNVLPKSEVLRAADSCGLRIERIGNINWRVFYDEQRFFLESETNELAEQPQFPLSHLYFFRKVA